LTVNQPQSDASERVRILIAKSADVNRFCEYTLDFPTTAAAKSYQFDVLLQLLKAGADPKAVRDTRGKSSRHSTLLHILAEQQFERPYVVSNLERNFQTLLHWLVEQGYTLEQAEEDFKQDGSWQQLSDEKLKREATQHKIEQMRKLRSGQ
jgi:hypothetical protein